MNIDILEGHGTLNFKTEWQSLDGRCCMKWHNTLEQAKAHVEILEKLGRIAQIWGRVEHNQITE